MGRTEIMITSSDSLVEGSRTPNQLLDVRPNTIAISGREHSRKFLTSPTEWQYFFPLGGCLAVIRLRKTSHLRLATRRLLEKVEERPRAVLSGEGTVRVASPAPGTLSTSDFATGPILKGRPSHGFPNLEETVRIARLGLRGLLIYAPETTNRRIYRRIHCEKPECVR